MTFARFRSRRSRERQLALAGGFPDDGESITEILERVRPADWDGTTIPFAGASDTGLPPDQVYAEADPAAGLRQAIELTALAERGPGAVPFARLRALPPPPPVPAAGYAAPATGPQAALGRERPAIGDALAADPQWRDKLAPLPCGHCGASLGAGHTGGLERTRVIGYLNHLAWQAGWKFDTDLTWTCPACQAGEAWKARQGQVEVHRGGTACQRNHLDPSPDGDCTCPGAVLAVDAMLASQDYLGSGRGRRAGGAR